MSSTISKPVKRVAKPGRGSARLTANSAASAGSAACPSSSTSTTEDRKPSNASPRMDNMNAQHIEENAAKVPVMSMDELEEESGSGGPSPTTQPSQAEITIEELRKLGIQKRKDCAPKEANSQTSSGVKSPHELGNQEEPDAEQTQQTRPEEQNASADPNESQVMGQTANANKMAGDPNSNSQIIEDEEGEEEQISEESKAEMERARKHAQRLRVVQEIIQTESTYHAALQFLVGMVLNGLRNKAMNGEPVMPDEKVDFLFGNIEEVRKMSLGLLESLEDGVNSAAAGSGSIRVGAVFCRRIQDLKIVYSKYCANFFEHAQSLAAWAMSDPTVKLYMKTFEGHEEWQDTGGLQAFLIQPVQRMPRYALLLQEVLKATDTDDVDHELVDDSLHQLRDALDAINSAVKVAELRGNIRDTESVYIESMEWKAAALPSMIDCLSTYVSAAPCKTWWGVKSTAVRKLVLMKDRIVCLGGRIDSSKIKHVIPMWAIWILPTPPNPQGHIDLRLAVCGMEGHSWGDGSPAPGKVGVMTVRDVGSKSGDTEQSATKQIESALLSYLSDKAILASGHRDAALSVARRHMPSLSLVATESRARPRQAAHGVKKSDRAVLPRAGNSIQQTTLGSSASEAPQIDDGNDFNMFGSDALEENSKESQDDFLSHDASTSGFLSSPPIVAHRFSKSTTMGEWDSAISGLSRDGTKPQSEVKQHAGLLFGDPDDANCDNSKNIFSSKRSGLADDDNQDQSGMSESSRMAALLNADDSTSGLFGDGKAGSPVSSDTAIMGSSGDSELPPPSNTDAEIDGLLGELDLSDISSGKGISGSVGTGATLGDGTFATGKRNSGGKSKAGASLFDDVDEDDGGGLF